MWISRVRLCVWVEWECSPSMCGGQAFAWPTYGRTTMREMYRGRQSTHKHDGSTTSAISCAKRTVGGVRIVSGARTHLGGQGSSRGRADSSATCGDAGNSLRGDVAGAHEDQQPGGECEHAGRDHHPYSAQTLHDRGGSKWERGSNSDAVRKRGRRFRMPAETPLTRPLEKK